MSGIKAIELKNAYIFLGLIQFMNYAECRVKSQMTTLLVKSIYTLTWWHFDLRTSLSSSLSFSGVEEELVLLLDDSGTMGGDDMRDGEYLKDDTKLYFFYRF